MLDKFVIHLRNIIFFKTILYIILLATLLAITPILLKNFNSTLEKKSKASDFLESTSTKLESIKNFGSKIYDLDNKYKRVNKQFFGSDCVIRKKLEESILFLTEEYNLDQIVKIKTTKVLNSSEFTENNNLKINYYAIELSFNINNYNKLLMLLSDLFKLIPNGSVVTNIRINYLNAITPYTLKSLKNNHQLNLIDTKIEIIVKEIEYDKPKENT